MEIITKIDITNWMAIATALWWQIIFVYFLWKCRKPIKNPYGSLMVNKKQSENCPAIPVDKIEMIAINDLGDGLYVKK